MFRPAFGCCKHPKAGRNTQQSVNVTAPEVGPENVTPLEVGPLNMTPPKLGPVNVTTSEVGSVNVTVSEVGPVNVAASEVGPVNMTPPELGPVIVTTPEVGGNVNVVGLPVEGSIMTPPEVEHVNGTTRTKINPEVEAPASEESFEELTIIEIRNMCQDCLNMFGQMRHLREQQLHLLQQQNRLELQQNDLICILTEELQRRNTSNK